MTITINAQGAERKRLVKTIAEWLGEDVHYCGAPTFAYEIGRFTVKKDGSLSFSDLIDSEVVERLLEHIYDEGFDIDQSHTEEAVTGVSIQMPLSEFTETALANLEAIVEAKGSLIKKALGTDDLTINRINGRLDFPWFPNYTSPEEVTAYMHFISALCEMAKTQKRITAKEKAVDNEKYAFRCFLLRLGFIGDEYKAERKILLRNLTGSSAFKSGTKEEK
jgi:hypothetical protein